MLNSPPNQKNLNGQTARQQYESGAADGGVKHLGYINVEGGPLLIIDASLCSSWKGASGGGSDYDRACQLFDGNLNFEGGAILIGEGTGMLWEMKGPGTADAFINDHVVILRTWPANPSDRTIPENLAAEPLIATSELGRVQVTTGVIAALWAAEDGSCAESGLASPSGRPTGPMAIESAGLIFQVDPGTYRCLHDHVETSLGIARRLHLVLM